MVPSSNLQDSSGRPYASSFSSQSAAAVSGFHHSGGIQGFHNNYGGYNMQSLPGSLASRNALTAAIGGMPSGNLQQPGSGGISGGRIASSMLPNPMPQLSHGSSHGLSGLTNKGGVGVVGTSSFSNNMTGIGGYLPGISPNTATSGNRNSVQGMGASQMLGNMEPGITNPLGNIFDGANIRRNINSSGISVPSLGSRANLAVNSGSGSLNLEMRRMLQHATPQMLEMLGISYPSSGYPLSQNQIQGGNNAINSMEMLNEVNTKNNSPFNINDFPQLSKRPSSAGAPQGSFGKQGAGVSSIVQQNQEFSIQNEDFPALPGFKGGSLGYPMDLHQKEQHQSQHIPIQNSGHSMNSQNPTSNMGAYDQSMLQYQHHPRYQSQFQPQPSPAANQSYNKDQSLDPVQRAQNSPHPYGVFGLLNMRKDPYLSLLGSGIDLSALGMNVTSSDNLYETFSSPWSDERSKGDPKYSIPACYYAMHPPLLHQGFFAKFQLLTLFYIFYSMPRDAAQIYAANELYNRGWFYHKEMKLWLSRVQNSELTVKTNTHERGSYRAFDPVNFESQVKENIVIYYDAVEKQPALPQQ